MSWHYLQGSAAVSSEALPPDGQPFAPLKSSHIAGKSYSNDNGTEFCLDSQFGTTFAHLTAFHGADGSMSFPAVFHAKIFRSPARDADSMAPVLVCGSKWRELFMRFCPNTSTLKTHRRLFNEDLSLSSATLPRWGMMRDGALWARDTPARLTKGNAYGYWLTPTALDANPIKGGNLYRRRTGTVRHMRPDGKSSNRGLAAQIEFPTPTVCGNYNRKGASPSSGDGLETHVRKWPTPTTRDYKDCGGNTNYKKIAKKGKLAGVAGGALSPPWAEWLMGWPVGWTADAPLSRESWDDWTTGAESWWDNEPCPRVTTEKKDRANRLKAIGNGQVPAAHNLALLIIAGHI